jgi:uncharacterized protein with PQ loop repeat
MNDQIINAIGFVGNGLLVVSYLFQIRKIIVTKKAEDLSLLMWICYLIGDACLLTYALFKNDAIVASLFTVMSVGNLIILGLSFKYGNIKKPIFPKEKSRKDSDIKDSKTL